MVPVEVTCPICSTSKKINIPIFLFEKKKTGTIKINVDTNICCAHQFIIFISKSYKVMGYESYDSVIEIGSKKVDKSSITFREILKTFDNTVLLLMFHAVIIECPIVIISSLGGKGQAKALNQFFNQILPNKHKSPFLFSSLAIDEHSSLEEKALVINQNGKIEKISWEKIPFNFERNLIQGATKILDETGQILIMKETINELFMKVEFLKKTLDEWARIDKRYNRRMRRSNKEYIARKVYEDECKDVLTGEYGSEMDEEKVNLILQIARLRFKAKIYHIDSDKNASVAKKMPKKH